MKTFNEIIAEVKAKGLTDNDIRQKVLEDVFDSANNDGDYLWGLIEWAYRDYTQEDYNNDFVQQDLMERV
jgi:hypothetical protein